MPSSLTAAERAKINRQNASKSTGPRTDEGKARSRPNAVRHGLRVETLAIPTENPAALQALAERWHDYYQPDSPGEEELVDSAVYAIVQKRRGARHLCTAITRQVRAAEVAFDQASREEVDRLGPIFFGPRPFEAIMTAKRTAAGCRFLLDFWDEVAEQFDRQGFLNPEQRDLLTRLAGVVPEESAREPLAYLIRLYNLLCQQNDCPLTFARLLEPQQVPIRLRETMFLWTPTPEHARDWLSEKIREDHAALEALEERLRHEIEEPDRADAIERAALLVGPEAALMLHYERMHEAAFHRAYAALLKGRKEAGLSFHREEEPAAPDEAITSASDDAGSAAPIEANRPAPIEAIPAPGNSARAPHVTPSAHAIDADVPGSAERRGGAPNEAGFFAPKEADRTAPRRPGAIVSTVTTFGEPRRLSDPSPIRPHPQECV